MLRRRGARGGRARRARRDGAGARVGRRAGRRGAPPRSNDGAADASARNRTAAEGSAATPGADAPRPSYTARLLADRNLRLKKLGEEAAELVLACADDDRPRAAEEAADLVYHTVVALRALGLSLDDVRRVLDERATSR